jgi:rhodanese-related sulfurtransferase
MVATVTPKQLVTLLATPGVDVIDVRNPDEWDTGHVAGSRLVPLDQLRADAEAYLDPTKTIVFVCAKGVRSMQAAKLAERLGYIRVANLEGGTRAWTEDGFALVTDSRVAA